MCVCVLISDVIGHSSIRFEFLTDLVPSMAETCDTGFGFFFLILEQSLVVNQYSDNLLFQQNQSKYQCMVL